MLASGLGVGLLAAAGVCTRALPRWAGAVGLVGSTLVIRVALPGLSFLLSLVGGVAVLVWLVSAALFLGRPSEA